MNTLLSLFFSSLFFYFIALSYLIEKNHYSLIQYIETTVDLHSITLCSSPPPLSSGYTPHPVSPPKRTGFKKQNSKTGYNKTRA